MFRAPAPHLVLALLCLGTAPARAQRADTLPTSARTPCDGKLITRVEVRAAPPPFSGLASRWQTLARGVGLHHATTESRVLEAYVALHVGDRCTEFRRAESERILRALPFIADAWVRVQPDSIGSDSGVVAIIETIDEIPVLVGGRFRGAVPEALSTGNTNVAGEGLRVEAGWERGRAYHTGFGAKLVKYAAFDRPYVLGLQAYQRRVGHQLGAEIGHPFYTDLQRISWHVGGESNENFHHFARPALDRLTLEVRDRRWDVGSIVRIFGTTTVGLLGAAATGREVEPAAKGMVMSDTGFVADTGTTLDGRYAPFRTTRVGVIAGLRRVHFTSVTGFDALTGPQDVASGVMGAVYAARGLPSSGDGDTFLSGAIYAGMARRRALLATLAELEGRRDLATNEWNSIVGSSRTALYLGGSPGMVLILSDELSGGVKSRLPLQLTLGDRAGGMHGYRRAALAGSRRNIARVEARWSAAAVIRRADVGVGAFGELGTLWAGDAPYGWTGSRGTLGVSLLAAYPTRSKRLYRADLGIPLTRKGEGGGRIELRFSSEDRTTRFWDEPDDVTRARTGADPSTLFAWPTR